MKVSEALQKALFWDVDPEKLEWQKNAQLIIERVLTRGNTFDFRVMIQHYSESQIIEAVIHSKSLDKKTAHFASRYFNVPLNQIHVAPEYY